ncbi:MAG: CPBP family intramembrane metalloprotease [Actinomycetaceae bacterium]|nr:CPBP family intramembrane metalloprotease [Actinomycetaceae bacterium]
MSNSNNILKKLGKQLYLTPGLILGMLFIVFAATSAGRELHAQLLGFTPLPAWHNPGKLPLLHALLAEYLPQHPLAVSAIAAVLEESLFTALGGILLTRQLPAFKPVFGLALLVLARVLYYLPVGMLAFFSVPLWALLLARFYQQTRAFVPVAAAHVAANLGVHQYSGEAPFGIWWNQQLLPLLLVAGALWLVIHFAPQVTFKTGRRKRIDLTNTWEDGWLSKALLWSMTVYVSLSMGYFVVSSLYALATGSFFESHQILAEVFGANPNTLFGIFTFGLITATALWWHFRVNGFKIPDLQAVNLNGQTNLLNTGVLWTTGITGLIGIGRVLQPVIHHPQNIFLTWFPQSDWLPTYPEMQRPLFNKLWEFPPAFETAFSGASEELIFSGIFAALLLFHRKLNLPLALAILVFLRISIHLYLGLTPVFWVPIWATFTVMFYYRTKLLFPLVAGHFIYNLVQSWSAGFASTWLTQFSNTVIFPVCVYLGLFAVVLFARVPLQPVAEANY